MNPQATHYTRSCTNIQLTTQLDPTFFSLVMLSDIVAIILIAVMLVVEVFFHLMWHQLCRFDQTCFFISLLQAFLQDCNTKALTVYSK